jgi:hypothetical protein
MVRAAFGKGLVYFLSDPIEESDDETHRELRRRLYEFLSAEAGRQTGVPISFLTGKSLDSRIDVCREPTTRDSVFIVAN